MRAMLTRRIAPLILALAVVLSAALAGAAPAAASYGEIVAVWNFDFSAVDRGCYAHLTVYFNRTVRPWCELRNDATNQAIWVGGYTLDCRYSSQCYYDSLIPGYTGWRPVAVWLQNLDSYAGAGGRIDNAWTIQSHWLRLQE